MQPFIPVSTNQSDVIARAELIAKRLAKRQAASVRAKILEYTRLAALLEAEGNAQVRRMAEQKMHAICQVLETYLPKKARGT